MVAWGWKSFTKLTPLYLSACPYTGDVKFTSERSFRLDAPPPLLVTGSVFREINSSVSFANAASSNTIVDPLFAVNSDVGNLTPLTNTSTNPTL